MSQVMEQMALPWDAPALGHLAAEGWKAHSHYLSPQAISTPGEKRT